MRRLRIEHLTTYQFTEAVILLPHKLFLRPREGRDIRIESGVIEISAAYQLRWQRDVSGNAVAIASFSEPVQRLLIASRILLQHFDDQPLDFLVEESAVQYPFQYHAAELVELTPYLLPVFPADQSNIELWLPSIWRPGQIVQTFELLDRLNKAIASGFTYHTREQAGVQTPAATLALGSGSCRDTATLFIEACRRLGLAARFVSGYLYSPFVQPGYGSTHAWAEVYLPGAGWKGFDTTSGLVVGNDHIAVAVNRHPESVPPVSGAFIAPTPQSPDMQVSVQVTEIPA
jgi:transglutaminase-like putative cysteine protease